MFTEELPKAARALLPTLRPMSDNSLTVLKKRYFDKDDNKTFKEDENGLFWRVGEFLARAEQLYNFGYNHHPEMAVEFFRLMRGGYFLPNSPTLANAGTRTGQLSACFVLPILDCLSNGKNGIMDTLTKAQLIFQTGGGVGYAFSRLRSANALVGSTKGTSTGPVFYMDVYDVACENIKQGGMRRGAQMGILRVDSPDIVTNPDAPLVDGKPSQVGFIERKSDLTKLTNFNVSVGVTDAFLEAVERGKRGEDDTYELIDPKYGPTGRRLSATMVWNLIKERAHATGEPGVVFLDRMNDENPVPGLGEYEATNPCGEQPLVPYESCNLGSMVQDRYVKELSAASDRHDVFLYSQDGKRVFDLTAYQADIRLSTRAMDDVVDMNEYVPARGTPGTENYSPGVPEIKETTLKTRKLGLGIMGMARALFMMGLSYDSDEGRRMAEYLYAILDVTSKEASVQLAKERGAFPYMQENWDECVAFYTRIWSKRIARARAAGFHTIADRYEALIPLMAEYGMRNSTTTTIAPTGTISIIAETSGGCEPEFSLYTSRWQAGVEMVELNPVFIAELRERDFTAAEIDLLITVLKDRKRGKGSLKQTLKYIGAEFSPASVAHLHQLKDIFVVAGDIAPRDHVLMQAALQKYNDSACSKTINFPEEATLEDVSEAYDLAVSEGCKGITIYRDNCRAFQPLTAGSKEEVKATVPLDEFKFGTALVLEEPSAPRPRPERLPGFNERVDTGDGTLHLQVGYDEFGIREVIANVGKGGGTINGLVEAIGRLVSLALKYRVPVGEIVKQLRGIRSANPQGIGPRLVLSVPDALGKVLAAAPVELVAATWGETEEEPSEGITHAEIPLMESVTFAKTQPDNLHSVHDLGESPECPQCSAPMKFGEGCRGGSCTDPTCGYAKC
jgi:ribonucleoside-diphosphate reductase alpha chain